MRATSKGHDSEWPNMKPPSLASLTASFWEERPHGEVDAHHLAVHDVRRTHELRDSEGRWGRTPSQLERLLTTTNSKPTARLTSCWSIGKPGAYGPVAKMTGVVPVALMGWVA